MPVMDPFPSSALATADPTLEPTDAGTGAGTEPRADRDPSDPSSRGGRPVLPAPYLGHACEAV